MKTRKVTTKLLLSPDNDPSMAQPPNWKNQTVLIGDNIDIMRAMNSQTSDLIATDPPFNKHKKFDHIFGGKKEFGFDDAWTLHAERNEEHKLLESDHNDLYEVCKIGGKLHSKGMLGYLVFMGVRLIECKRILKETGSIYLHCDHSANTYLRLLMDGIFGQHNFRNEIIWHYGKTSNAAAKKFLRGHDTILFYAKNAELATYNSQFETRLSIRKQQLVDSGYNTKNMNGHRYLYIYDEEKVDAKVKSGKIKISEFDIIRRVDTTRGNALTTVWEIDHLNSQSKEKSGWATQKPIALYSRIILASTNPGDVVFDPFCGCATTLVAAENAGRQWIGIDRHPEAEKQVVQQLNKLNKGTETETQNELGKDWGRRVIIINTYEKDKDGKVKKDKNGKFISLKQLPIARTDLAATIPYKKHFNDLYTNQNGICKGCGRHVDKHIAHIDHKVPRTKGGQDHFGNLQILCSGCNTLKGNRTMAWLMKTLKERGLMVNQSNAY